MKKTLWLGALPLSLAVHAAMAGTNLIADAGFEEPALGWTGAKSVLALDPAAAYRGQAGMTIASNYGWYPYDAVYTLDTADLRNGTLYEFGARVRLAPGGAESANIKMGLIRNGASPLWLDGDGPGGLRRRRSRRRQRCEVGERHGPIAHPVRGGRRGDGGPRCAWPTLRLGPPYAGGGRRRRGAGMGPKVSRGRGSGQPSGLGRTVRGEGVGQHPSRMAGEGLAGPDRGATGR